jgi:hypothetical protein
MDDTPEMIRQQMEQTKSNLTEKMESLEHQVSDTVQSTGTAVNATVGAVQKTVETVTGAVQGAVQSVSNAVNLRRQVDRHPLLVLGGAVALGYLAYEFLNGQAKKAVPPSVIVEPPATNTDEGTANPTSQPAITSVAQVAAYESGREHAALHHRTRNLAIDALIGVAHAVAVHAVPHVMNYFIGNRSAVGASHSEGTGEPQDPSPEDAGRRLRITPSGNSI